MDEHLEPLPIIDNSYNLARVKHVLINWFNKAIRINAGKTITPIDTSRAMIDYGLDSVLEIQIIGMLSEWLGDELSAYLLYQFQTIDELIEYLARKCLKGKLCT